MAASADVLSYHGATPQGTVVTGQEVRHKRADNDTPDLADPIPIPASGAAYGWRKHFKLQLSTAPSQQVSNLQFYFDPLPSSTDPAQAWSGISIYAGITTTYVQGSTADETGPITGIQPYEGGTPGTIPDVDVAGYDSQNPMQVVSGVFLDSSDTYPTVGTTQPYVVVQMSCDYTALPGIKAGRNAYYRYDEV